MDAFSAAICKGLSVKRITLMHMLIVGLYFGIFQGLMPVIGYVLGDIASVFLERFGGWVTLVVLGFIAFIVALMFWWFRRNNWL